MSEQPESEIDCEMPQQSSQGEVDLVHEPPNDNIYTRSNNSADPQDGDGEGEGIEMIKITRKRGSRATSRQKRKPCPECGRIELCLPRHLRNVHKYSQVRSLQWKRNPCMTDYLRRGGKHQSEFYMCSYPNCPGVVTQPKRHIKIHKLSKVQEENYLSKFKALSEDSSKVDG